MISYPWLLELINFYRRIIEYVSNTGTVQFLNFALQDPARFVVRNNYIHSSSDLENPQRFFTVGITTYSAIRDLYEHQRCRQICLAPVGMLSDRGFTFAAKVFGLSTVNVTQYHSGVSFSSRMVTQGIQLFRFNNRLSNHIE